MPIACVLHQKTLGYNALNHARANRTMAPTDLQAKKAHAASKRRSNYAASLRLEGFATSLEDAEKPLPSKEDVLKAYMKPTR